MSEYTYDQIRDCVLKHCEKSLTDLTPTQETSFPMQLMSMTMASSIWQKPGDIEDQLETVRAKLSDAIDSVRKMDPRAKVYARNYADRDRETKFIKEVQENNDADLSVGEWRHRRDEIVARWKPQPQFEWVDYAALSAMEKLRDSLVKPLEYATSSPPAGPGRPVNRQAYKVAEHAYLIYVYLTEEEPGFWEGGATPFSRMVKELYEFYGINASLKKPILAAMHIQEKGLIKAFRQRGVGPPK